MSAVDPCIFCEKFSTFHSFGPLLNKALYSKYSSSQNYFYSKEINDIIDSASTAAVVAYKDLEMLNEEEEYLKRGYPSSQICKKMTDLTEYYKYHKDIPRLFMPSIGSIMNRYHDKRRRIEYDRIKKELHLETSEHEDKNEAKDENETNREDDDEEDEDDEEEQEEIQGEKQNENNNNNKDKNDKRNDKNKQERKKKKLQDALNQCENLLVNLEITSSFHERTKGQPPRIVGKYSPRTDFNPFYMHCNNPASWNQKQSSRKNMDSEQSGDPNFDLSSFLHKLNNSSFFKQSKSQQQPGQVQQPSQKRQLPANFNYQFEQKSTSQKQQQQQLSQTREPTSYALSILIQQSSSTTEQQALRQFYSSELSLSNMSFILGMQSATSSQNSNNQIMGFMFDKNSPNNNIAAYNVAGQHTKLPPSLVKKKQDQEDNSNKLPGNQLKNHIQPKGKTQTGTTGAYSKASLAQQSTRLSAEGYPTADSNNSKNNVMISNIFANRTTNSELSQIILQQKQSLAQQKEAEADKLTGTHQNQRLLQLQQLEQQSSKDQQMQAGFDQRRSSNIDLEEQLTFEDFKNNGLPQQISGISKTISMPEKKNNHYEVNTNYQADGSKEQGNTSQQQQYPQNKQNLDQHRVQNYQNTYNKSNNNNNNNGQSNIHSRSTNGSISSTSYKILQKRSSDQGNNNNIYASQTAMVAAAAAVQSSQVAQVMAGMQSAAAQKTKNSLSLQNSQQGYQHNMENQKNDVVNSNGVQQEYNSLAQGGLYYPNNGDKNSQSNSNNNLLVFFNNNNNTFNQNYASVHATPADAGTSYQPNSHSNNASSSQISLSAQQYQSNGIQQLPSASQQLQSLQQQLTHKSSIEGMIPGRYQTADRERMQIDRRELNDKGSFSSNQMISTPAPVHKGSPSHNDSLKNHRQQQQQQQQQQPQQSMSQRHSRDQLFSTSKDSQLLKQLNLLSPPQQSVQQFQENQYKVVSQIKSNNTNSNSNLLSSRPRSSLHAASNSITATTNSSSQLRQQQQEQAKLLAHNHTKGTNNNSHSESTSLVRSSGSQNPITTRIENSNNYLGNTPSQISSQQQQQVLLGGQSKHQMSLSQANINASNSNNQNYYSNDHSNNSRSLTPGLNLGMTDGQRYQQSSHTSSQQSSYQPISQVQYQQQQQALQQQQQAPERSYRNSSQTMSNGDLRIKKRKEGQTFLGGNNSHGISNASSMISAFGSSSKSNSTTVTVSSSRNKQQQHQSQHQQPQQQSSQQQSSSQLLLLLQNPLSSQSKQQQQQYQQQQSHTNIEKNSFYSSLPVSPQLSFNSTNQGQLLLQQNPLHKQQQQQSHSNNFFNSKRTCNNNTGNADLIRTQQVFSKGSNAIMGAISQKNRSSSNPKNYKQQQQQQQQQILGQGINDGVYAAKNQIDNNHVNQQLNMLPLSSSSSSNSNRLQQQQQQQQQQSMGQQQLHEIASSLVLNKQSSANQQTGLQQQLLALQNQQLQQQNYQQQQRQQQQQHQSANNASSTARGKAMSTHFSESIKRFVDSNSSNSNNIKDSLGSPGSAGQPLLLSSSQSSGRNDSLHTRVSNIANIFDSSSALQQQQQQQQQLLQQSSSQQQLINNVQAYKTQYQNSNNTNSKQQQQINQLSSNSIQNSKPNTNQYNSQHLQILQNSNISGNVNYPQSARVPLLNIKTSTNRNNQQVISLSRNNSPNKSQSSNENASSAIGGGFQSDQNIDVQKSRITAGFNSPSQSSGIIFNQGNTGNSNSNNMAQYKQIQQQGSTSNSTSRAGSTQRAATKASSLIRFRQNP